MIRVLNQKIHIRINMEKKYSKPIQKKKIFYKPHGFKKLITVDGIGLVFFAALIGYFIGFLCELSQTISLFIASIAIILAVAGIVSIKPKEYVTVLNDGILFKATRLLIQSYEAKVYFSEIEKIETYILSNGFIGSAYLEIFLENGQSHKFAKEIFYSRSDFDEFKRLLINRIKNP